MKRDSVIAWTLCLIVFLGAIAQLVVWQRGLSAPPALWVLFMVSLAFDDMLTAPYEGWQIANPLSLSSLQQFEGTL